MADGIDPRRDPFFTWRNVILMVTLLAAFTVEFWLIAEVVTRDSAILPRMKLTATLWVSLSP